MASTPLNIVADDLSSFKGKGPAFVTFGEVMVRDTPADDERIERTRLVRLSMAGSEYTLAMGLSRLGIPSSFITRVPDNPYGWAVRDIAREQGINTDHIVWAPKTEPIGRYLYELGRTPRPTTGWYQRMYSAASKFGTGMVDWAAALKDARLFHTSGITFGLFNHSGYERNYCLEAFYEAMESKPEGCMIGLDFNYRSTLWSKDQAVEAMTPILRDHVDYLITTIEDMALLYGMGAGQYSAEQIVKGDFGHIEDDDLKAFMHDIHERFKTKVVAVTIRYPDSFEQHRWESAAMDTAGNFFRSPAVRSIVLWDRLGGGDTWNAGFYYGLLTAEDSGEGLRKGVLVGDAFTCLKQTLMFDLPIVTKDEVQSLLRTYTEGGGRRTVR
ncbi:MAG TPA: sugar kinase [Chloroflexi bacterium]|jgi:2-dehydro-3-deoxygluconokinase|nr:sugar kinase [Chloroflexota bacterium]